MFNWALYDDDGKVVRYFDYPAEGAMPFPPQHETLPVDDPEWHNPLF